MAKYTRTQRRQLENVLHNMESAWRYLLHPDRAIAMRGRPATTTLDYQRPDGATLYEINKESGSELIGLPIAIRQLKTLLEAN